MSHEVRLRNIEPDDLPIFYEQQLDADATRMAAFPPRDRATFDAHWAANIIGNPAAVTQTILVDGHVAGNIGSWPQDGVRLVGYWIGKQHWGRGIATQALAAFLDVVIERPLHAHVARHNVGSIRVLEKCGFTLERDETVEITGEDVAELVFVLSDSDPLLKFRAWWEMSRTAGLSNHPGAVCVSTVDEHGVPEGRFVDLKEVSDQGFVFGTNLDSPKARALAANPSVGLTFWWDHVERQIRVVGRAERLSDPAADALFATRSREAQLTSWGSQQSAPLMDSTAFERRLTDARRRFADVDVPRPHHWGAYCVVPARIEFLEFRASRIHIRTLFERHPTGWRRSLLQP